MKPTSTLLFLSLSRVAPCWATLGLPGITKPIDEPACAVACIGTISTYPLECSVENHHDDGSGHSHGALYSSPECHANDGPYLTTLAWCLKSKCAQYNIPRGRLEVVWEETATGDPTVPAKWSYSEALSKVNRTPSWQLDDYGLTVINETYLTPGAWNLVFDTTVVMAYESTMENIYGLVLLVTGFAVPIILTWLGYLPFMGKLHDKLRPYLVTPSLIGTYHVQPLPYLLGNAPTIGQALFIALMVILNILVTAIGYHSAPSHMWLRNQWQQTVGFLMYRTGVLSYAMFPLVILFSGRNNILLWLTNWSHSTYLLLHRWIARLFLLQALLHSILAVVLYKNMGIYDVQSKLDYWAWGVVATVLGCVTLFLSTLYVRQRWYELFLISHIVIAVIVLVGCWYHVILRFPKEGGGFATWLYIAIAVWGFDRVARVARIVKTGIRRANVQQIGDGYLRVDIEGVRWGSSPGRHVYVHFPTINPLRPWESHPFSVLPTSLFHHQKHTSLSPQRSLSDDGEGARQGSVDPEKHVKMAAPTTKAVAAQNTGGPISKMTSSGITLFIRKSTGMTRALPSSSNGLLTLLDGPYPNNKTSAILSCDRVLLVAGGIGITGVLPWVDSHPSVKLAWSMKQSARCLVVAMEGILGRIAEEDKDVRVGKRLDIDGLLVQEVESGWQRIGVVVCGPGSLCDDARAAVTTASRENKAVFVLEVDAFAW